MASKRYVYYVSYMTGIKSMFSARICTLEKKITTKEDIDELRKQISHETGFAFVNIVAFSFLTEEKIEKSTQDDSK